jgi:VWFA-related protein
MTNRLRWALGPQLALLLATSLAAQAQKSFSETTSVVVVEIPVNVTADGQPLAGLKAEDFEVFDGRKKLPLVGFEVIDLSTSQAAEKAVLAQPLPTAGRRHFLLLFDLTFSEPSSIIRAREAAKELVLKGLHPEDLAAVALYSAQHGPRILLGFTPDRAQLELALDTLGDPKFGKRAADPLNLVFAELTAQPGTTARGGAAGGITDEAVRDYLQGLVGLVTKAERRELENRVANMTRQLAELARLLDSVEGRKYVVLLSEGFDDSLLVGRGAGQAAGVRADPSETDLSAGATGATTTADRIASGELASVESEEMYGSGQTQNDLMSMLQAFKRSNCTIQAVDIAGLRAGGSVRPQTTGENVLSQMASETGGEVFRNFNNLAEAMSSVLSKTSVTYLLAIQPEDLKLDGKYHRLRVRLKESPRGADLYHRPGYYAPLPLKEQGGLERQLRTASELLGEEGGDLATAAWAAPYRVPSAKTYVPVLIEVDGRSVSEGLAGDVLPLEIYTYALDSAGSVHDFFAQTMGIDLKQTAATLKQTGLKYYGHLDLDPGAYSVRVLVRNLETGRSSLKVLSLSVPDFSAASPVLLPPHFPEPLGKWVLLRENPERQRSVPFPFMAGDQPFLPAAIPVLAAKGETEVRLPAYNLGAGPFQVNARLLGADGSEQKGCELGRVERLASGGGAETLVLSLRHSGVPPGEYALEITVTDPASGNRTTTSAPLIVAAKS